MEDKIPVFLRPPLVISNSLFINNRATLNGGSLAIQGVTASVQLTGCTFLNSTSEQGWGGSVYVQATELRLRMVFVTCTFDQSVAVRGGAVFASSVWLSMIEVHFLHTYGQLRSRRALCSEGHFVAAVRCGARDSGEMGGSWLSALISCVLFVFFLPLICACACADNSPHRWWCNLGRGERNTPAL